jgi:hypothetical protein
MFTTVCNVYVSMFDIPHLLLTSSAGNARMVCIQVFLSQSTLAWDTPLTVAHYHP